MPKRKRMNFAAFHNFKAVPLFKNVKKRQMKPSRSCAQIHLQPPLINGRQEEYEQLSNPSASIDTSRSLSRSRTSFLPKNANLVLTNTNNYVKIQNHIHHNRDSFNISASKLSFQKSTVSLRNENHRQKFIIENLKKKLNSFSNVDGNHLISRSKVNGLSTNVAYTTNLKQINHNLGSFQEKIEFIT